MDARITFDIMCMQVSQTQAISVKPAAKIKEMRLLVM